MGQGYGRGKGTKRRRKPGGTSRAAHGFSSTPARVIAGTARRLRKGLPVVLRRLPRLIAFAFAGFFAFSILWVLIYRFAPPPLTHQMLKADGVAPLRYDWVPLEAMAPALVATVIGAEDGRFCSHGGFDWAALEGALAEARNGARPRGASTISQQTAKNAFLWSGRSWLRKGLEAYFTFLMEFAWPKRRIMEVYLNIAEFGPGVFGAGAAAEAYFGKTPGQLTRAEAALMAAVLPNPNRFRIERPSRYVKNRAGMLERRAKVVEREGYADCAKP